MRYALAGNQASSPTAARVDRWFLAACLGPLAFGIVFAVALLQYHYAFAGARDPQGFWQRATVAVYAALGFMPSLYLCLLVVLWGGIAFVTGTLRGPLRRIAAAFMFSFSFALLTAALGGDGGTIGETVAGRLAGVLGTVLTVMLLGALTLTALLLATDWFFYQTFLRLSRSPSVVDATRDRGLGECEEERLAEAAVAVVAERPAEAAGSVTEDAAEGAGEDVILEGDEAETSTPPAETWAERRRRRLGLVPIPVSPSALAQDRDAPDRTREQDLMNRVLEEARRDLSAAAAGRESALAPEPGLDEDAAQEDDVTPARTDVGDPLDDLDDDDLLARAGAALDEAWSEGAWSEGAWSEGARSEEARSEGDAPFGIARANEDEAEEDPGYTVTRDESLDVLDELVEEALGDSLEELAASREEAGREEAGREEAAREEASRELAEADSAQVDGANGADDVADERVNPAAAAELPEAAQEQTPPVRADDLLPEELREEAPDEAPDEAPEDAPAEPAAHERTYVIPPPRPARVQQTLFAEDSEPPDDELVDRAVRVLLAARRPMPSVLQRQLGIGFAEARRVLEHLADLGAVARAEGSGPWTPLIDLHEWEARAR